MTLSTKVANALSFAHLGGLARKSALAPAAASNDDDEDKKEQDREETHAKGAKAEGDDDERKKRDDESDDEYAARMAALDDDEEAAEDEPEKKDDQDEDKAKSKSKAKSRADDDDKDEEMRGDSVAASARRREQARCAAIFASKAAAMNPVLAANLAFKTRMGRAEALAVLEGTPAQSAGAPHAGRAARNPAIAVGGAMDTTAPQAIASAWDRAFAKASPRRKPSVA